ncbi:carboxylating nicotinate-nucleotide diphosphorylase [Bacillus coahuilensis]|uniref:carboxylating nicotinate-nucleotide diphosphorylase n=1 Tax=Bacillus coahuilensis TaxID=408580 RepID=UPI00018510AC|nr:carboxylating nicotinate-nucleotide diphosphorylase [Bacillus coahuilensis]
MNTLKLKTLLESFFIEDIGDGDLSSESLFMREDQGTFHFISKENGIFCGRIVIEEGFRLLDSDIDVLVHVRDGETVEKGHLLAEIKGPMASLLTGERVILNLIQRMSGIATNTKKVVSLVEGTGTRICDTRKTTPGLRMLEKYAVTSGGGYNHRFGLYDAVMLKDNHIAFAGGISEAVRRVKNNLGHTVKVEVEIESYEQMREAIDAGADIIMFDNRTPDEISEWIKDVPPHIVTEASGGITMENVSEYGKTGVNYISLGYLTHSYKSLDISAKVLNL